MSLETFGQQIADFVRTLEVWALPIVLHAPNHCKSSPSSKACVVNVMWWR
jgi:hypothetical protein